MSEPSVCRVAAFPATMRDVFSFLQNDIPNRQNHPDNRHYRQNIENIVRTARTVRHSFYGAMFSAFDPF
jgi:hypothetical protein